LVRFLRTSAGHYAFDRLTLKLPLFGKLSRGINAARFASTLSILTKSGVPLVDALKRCSSNNWVIRDSVNLRQKK
jgi:general secretion pathway protein F